VALDSYRFYPTFLMLLLLLVLGDLGMTDLTLLSGGVTSTPSCFQSVLPIIKFVNLLYRQAHRSRLICYE